MATGNSSRPSGRPRVRATGGSIPNARGRRFVVGKAYKPNSPRRMHGPGKYTPWPGRGPYAWKISSAPWPVPQDKDSWLSAGTWIYAPGDSHLHSFGFLDARTVESIRDNSTRPSDWYSVLVVKYKDVSKGYWGEGSEYAFFSKNHERLEFIFMMMTDAESPGELGWSHLTSEMIPYMEVE